MRWVCGCAWCAGVWVRVVCAAMCDCAADADAFYSIGHGALFGIPGEIGAAALSNHAVVSTDSGGTWRPWYAAS